MTPRTCAFAFPVSCSGVGDHLFVKEETTDRTWAERLCGRDKENVGAQMNLMTRYWENAEVWRECEGMV